MAEEVETKTPITVVVGVDSSEASLHALRQATRFVTAAGGEIVVTFSRSLPPVVSDETGDVTQLFQDEIEDSERKTKEEATKILDGADLKWRFVVRDGDPAQQIIEVAHETKADLVVIGAHQHGAVASVVTMSVAGYLMHHCDISFVVIRPLPET